MGKLLEAIDRARSNSDAEPNPPGPSRPEEVERREPVEAPGPEQTPYAEAKFKISGSQHVKLHEAATAGLAEYVVEIVAFEGPVHIDEVGRRLSQLWGYQRAGSRIQAAVRQAADLAIRRNRILYVDGAGGQFLDRPERTEKAVVRDRSDVKSQTLRKVEMLPPSEIREGVLLAVKRNIGINAEECAREVSRMFGFKSLRADLRNGVAKVADELVAEGRLVLSGEELRLA